MNESVSATAAPQPPRDRTPTTVAQVAGEGSDNRAFELLHPRMQRWCWKQQWQTLRTVQSLAIPPIMRNNRHILLCAQTAGGKTEAAILPLVSRILYERKPGTGFELLYISPLKALINDQHDRLEKICSGTGVAVQPWHGEIPTSQKQQARDNPQGILLITPESLEAFLVHRYTSLPRLFRRTTTVLLDEYHALVDNERGMQTLSLISRIEEITGKRMRRIALSATIGDVSLAAAQLWPNAPEEVTVIQPPGEGLRTGGANENLELSFQSTVQRRRTGRREKTEVEKEVADDIFKKLRGKNNLVFAESRQYVEAYAERLRTMCEQYRVPNEFWPHHGSLSGDHRAALEQRLKSGEPTTAVCTSTLELGIDIGDIETVCQVRPPYSVASLRQRLGRSGRRGDAAKLRMYVIEMEPTKGSHPIDWLHLELMRGVAMVELLKVGWCEPAKTNRLHLSTLTHQVLSSIAGLQGATASRLYQSLCIRGAFRSVTSETFVTLLNELGNGTTALIEQEPGQRRIRLSRAGEALLQRRDFYAAFRSTECYHVMTKEGQPLGSLPLACPLTPATPIIFSGRNWLISSIDTESHIVRLEPHTRGELPKFSGSAGDIHQHVIDTMFETLEGTKTPVYLDDAGQQLLREGRLIYEQLELQNNPILEYQRGRNCVATRLGSQGNLSLKILLEKLGWDVYCWNGFIDADEKTNRQGLLASLEQIAAEPNPDPDQVLAGYENLIVEKYHEQIGPALLAQDLASSRLDFQAAASEAGRIAATTTSAAY